MIEVHAAARTHQGKVRYANEDAVLARGPVFLVADGMGGHDAGDRASQAAIAAFADTLGTVDGAATVEQVSHAYATARHAVRGVAEGTVRGAGCTLSGAVLVERDDHLSWLILNIGDSRTYVLDGQHLEQVTRDHTLLAELLEHGADPEDPRLPTRNVITRALGSPADEIDTWIIPAIQSQRLLICSDGLHEEVSDEHIHSVLLRLPDADAAADELLRLALSGRAADNISLVVVDVVRGPEFASDDDTADTLDVTRE